MKFNFFVGTHAGYSVNDEFGKANISEADFRRAIGIETKLDILTNPGKAVYNQAWGCPNGGEFGYFISGNLPKEEVTQLALVAKEKFNQSTIQIQFEDNMFQYLTSESIEHGEMPPYQKNCYIDYSIKTQQPEKTNSILQNLMVEIGDKSGSYPTFVSIPLHDSLRITSSQNPNFADKRSWELAHLKLVKEYENRFSQKSFPQRPTHSSLESLITNASETLEAENSCPKTPESKMLDYEK